ncbi:hypothetical protein D9M72_496630 [compost metagenome]
MTDAAAVEQRPVKGVRRGDRNALCFGGLYDVVVSADLRCRHDDAVDRRILNDLIKDFDLAGRIVHRRLRAKQQDLGADHVAGHRGANIDGIEKAVPGRVRHDTKGEVSVGRMEVLGTGRLFCGVLETVASDRLLDTA